MPKLTDLDVQFVSLVDRAAVRDPVNQSEPQRFLLWKRDGATPPTGGTMTPEETAALKKAQDERAEAIAKAEKAEQENAKLAAEVEKLAKAAKPVDEPTPVNKADLPSAVREMIEKAEAEASVAKAEREQLRKDTTEARELAKAERDQRLTREFVAKAQDEFPQLGSPEQLGPRLKRMSESLSKEDYDAHLTELAAANAQIEAGALFKQFGVDGDPQPGNGEQEVTRKAQEIRKADPSLSEYEALRRAMRDPHIQAAYAATR